MPLIPNRDPMHSHYANVYTDHVADDGRTMVRTYATGRRVHYVWSETDSATGAGVWLLDMERA